MKSIKYTKIQTMKHIITLFLSLFILSNLSSQNQLILRLDNPQESDFHYFNKSNDEITAYIPGQYLDILVNPDRMNELLKESWDFRITQSTEQNIKNLQSPKDIAGYHTYEEALEVLQEVAANYPEICTLTDIADSHGKEYFNDGVTGYEDYQHDIWMLKISDNVNENEDEPAVYYMGAHHAREPISTEVVLGIIEHLTTGYGNDEEITNMIDNAEIYIIPMVNPDGHEVVLNQLNTWWRKNAADNNENGVFSYTSDGPDGVDPNRNYGWNWSGEGASGNPNSDLYYGPYAFSEPELAAMRDLMASHPFTAGISYHSYSELVLYPYGYSSSCQAPDHEALSELAINMAETIPKIVGSGHYYPEQANDLYPASGVTDDWAYGNHGIFSFTVELGQEFIPSASQVPTIVSDNIEAAMILLNRPNHQVLRGHIYDAETLDPIVAQVFIDGIDNNGASFREAYKSSEAFGAYYRLLKAGNVEATYSAYGYLPQTISDLSILSDEASIQDVYLTRTTTTTISGSVLDGSTGEDIEGAEVTILNTPLDPVYTDENGFYNMEEVSYGDYTIKVNKEGYSPALLEKTINNEQTVFSFVLLPSEAITFEEGVFNDDFTMTGQPWVIDNSIAYEGDYSSASGNINDNSSSTMILHIENRAAGAISFYTKVSTESSYDFLKFYIDGTMQDQWSGEMTWTAASFVLSEGDHDLKWEYKKDGNTIGGSDKVWVDYIEIPPMLTTTANAGPDQLICHNETAQLNAFADNYNEISWSTNGDGNFDDSAILDPIYTPGANDINNESVELTLTASGTENISDHLFIEIELCTGIEQLYIKPDFVISPNPAEQQFTVSLHAFTGGSFEILSVSGESIFFTMLPKDREEFLFNSKNLTTGIYLVKLTNNNGYFSVKRVMIK